MDELEKFEALAKAFYRETGMMAPGKDCPFGTHDHETRWACWRVWLKTQDERDRLRAELEAYKRAKAENDERFIGERDEARAEVGRLQALIGEVIEHVYPGDGELTLDLIKRLLAALRETEHTPSR